MTVDDEILQRLDRIQATLALAFAPQLGEARERIRDDAVSAAILDLTEKWAPSTELQKKAAKRSGATERTVRKRLPELVRMGALDERGTERRAEFRRTGLI